MSENQDRLVQLLAKYLQEGEQVVYDPTTSSIRALKEGAQRDLSLPEDVRREALLIVRRPLYG